MGSVPENKCYYIKGKTNMSNTRKTARLLSFLMVLAVLLTAGIVLGINASAAETHTVTTAQEFADALAAAAAGDTITLGADIYLGDLWTITDNGDGTASAKPITYTINKNLTITSSKKEDGSYYTLYRGVDFSNKSYKTITVTGHAPIFRKENTGATLRFRNITLDGQKVTEDAEGNQVGIIDAHTVGSAFDINGGRVAIENNVVIQNFNGWTGAVAQVRANGIFRLVGGRLTGNEASGFAKNAAGDAGANNAGGATIFLNYGKMVMVGGSIENNKSTSKSEKGSAIFLLGSNARFIMTGGEIKNNQLAGSDGGAIGIRGGTVQVFGGEISDNIGASADSQVGRAIRVTSSSSSLPVNIYLAGGTIGGNSNNQACKSEVYLYGTYAKAYIGDAELLYDDSGYVTLPEERTPVILTTSASGGTTFAYGNSATAAQVTITSELAAGSRVLLNGNPTITATLTDPCALAHAVYTTSGALIYQNSTITFGTPAKVGETVYTNLADAVQAAGDKGTVSLPSSIVIPQTLPAGEYTLSGDGNTLYRVVAGQSMFTVPAGANVTFANVTLEGNALADTTTNGGAFNVAAGATLTLAGAEDAEVAIQNFAGATGSAIYANGTLVLEDASFVNNDVYVAQETFALAGGSVDKFVKNDDKLSFELTTTRGNAVSVTMPITLAAVSNGTIYNTLADAAGAANEGTIVLKYMEFPATAGITLPTGTYTLDGDGQTFYRQITGKTMISVPKNAFVTFINITLDGANIEDTATSGTAIKVATGGSATLGNGATVQNFSSKQGAVQANGGTLILNEGCLIQNNVASGAGAAIYGYAATVVMNGGTIDNNVTEYTGTAYGGGLYFAARSTFTMNGGTISNNKLICYKDGSIGAYGGGLGFRGADFIMNGGTITGNEAISIRVTEGGNVSSSGGGAYVGTHSSYAGYGNFVMTGGTISNNEVKSFNPDGETPILNVSSRGAALTTSLQTWLLGGTISGNANVQGDLGGAIHAGSGEVYLLGTTICNNEIPRDNGGAKASAINAVTLYAMGGAATNNIGTTAIFNATNFYLGATASATSIPAVVLEFANTDAGKAVFALTGDDANGYVITAKKPLIVKSDTPAYIPDTAILTSHLVAGSEVAVNDTDSELGYFLPLTNGYTPDEDTLAAFVLGCADPLYDVKDIAKVNEAGDGLTWTYLDKAYTISVNAVLGSDIGFRVTFARRNPAVRNLLNNVTVELSTKAKDEETGDWIAKPAVPYYSEQTYNGSPCIMINLAPRQIMDEIIVKKGDTIVNKDETAYTLKTYLEALLTNETYGELAQATIDYCTAAQVYFNYNAEVLANPAYANNLESVDDENAMTLADDNNQYFHSAQVDVGSKVSMIIVINANAKVSSVSGLPYKESNTMTDEYGNTYYAFQFENINATDLTKTVTIELEDGAKLIYSVPAYAYNMQTKGAKQSLVDLVQALNAYAIAAKPFGAN